MNITLPIRIGKLAALLILLSAALQAQQLKLGINPTAIKKSALLELESTTQGLLLTRISDTTTASPISAADDGTLIYFTPDNSLRIRSGNIWQKVNTGTSTATGNYIENITSGTQTASFAITGNGSVGGTFRLPSLASGSVLFMDGNAIGQNANNFYWDNATQRLAIGIGAIAPGNIPGNKLDLAGTVAATGVSGLRLRGLAAATPQTSNSKVLSINNNGDVIVTQNAAANNWLITGNTNVDANTQFLGTLDDRKMVIKSNNQPYLEFGRRQTLGLTQNYPDYTDNNEKVTLLSSALQFDVPAVVQFYKPKMFTDANGNFRLKGASAGTDFFELGAAGSDNNGSLEFVIGDDGDEPIIFKSYNYATTSFTELMRMQNGRVGVRMAGAVPAANLDVNGNFKLGEDGTVMTGIFRLQNVNITSNNTDVDDNETVDVSVNLNGPLAGRTINTGANIIVNPRSGLPNGLGIASVRRSGNTSIIITFISNRDNNDLGSVNFDITIIQ